ncbi:MAG: hypothetical protein K2Q24_02700 [Chitinophagaceae bacterium]|nr:hypothetical protein [Chitinophagaceae bacterium]
MGGPPDFTTSKAIRQSLAGEPPLKKAGDSPNSAFDFYSTKKNTEVFCGVSNSKEIKSLDHLRWITRCILGGPPDFTTSKAIRQSLAGEPPLKKAGDSPHSAFDFYSTKDKSRNFVCCR